MMRSDTHPRATRPELERDLADARTRIFYLEMQAADARHRLAHHASFGNRRAIIAHALGILEGKPMAPCPCVGGAP